MSSPSPARPTRAARRRRRRAGSAPRRALEVDGVLAHDDVALDDVQDVDLRAPRAGERHRHRADLAGGRAADGDDQRSGGGVGAGTGAVGAARTSARRARPRPGRVRPTKASRYSHSTTTETAVIAAPR